MKKLLIVSLTIIVFIACKKTDDNAKPYITTHTINWMQDLIAEYPDSTITLKKIAMPRAHDAGMYEVNECIGGNACNTQTQNRDMTSMLESGIRVFDVRPVYENGVFWTFHKTECGQYGFGCNGVALKSFLEQTKTFLDTHSELVILELDKFCNTSPEDVAFLDLLNTTLGSRIYKETTAQTGLFINKPLKDILIDGGKVVLLMKGIQVEDKAQGYFAVNFINKKGSYADKPYLAEMKADQLSKFQNYNPSSSNMFAIYWTQTMDNALAVTCLGAEKNPLTIEDITKDATANLAISIDEWIGNGTIVKNKIPNIISVDFASTLVTEQCIKVSKFNLE